MKLPAMGYYSTLNNPLPLTDIVNKTREGITLAACLDGQTIPEHQAFVEQHCRAPYACSPHDDCATLLQKSSKSHNCYAARSGMNTQCYNGGDDGHRQAADNAYQSATTCRNYYNYKVLNNLCG